jgi:hypothetical protein
MQADRLADLVRRDVVRRQRITAVLVLASCAVTVVSAVTWRERQLLRRAGAQLATCERRCDEVRPVLAPRITYPAHFPDPAPLVGPTLLDVPLEVLCPAGDLRETTLDDATTPGAPHLVNLWQLSCRMCKQEFPLFERALAAGEGAPHTRFLPIDDVALGHPASDYTTARASHGMPTPSLALVDRGPDGGLLLPALQSFARDIALPGGTDHLVYPLSFVLDCDRRLRWWKVGGVSDAEADELAALLDTLRDEPTCRPDAPPPSVCVDPRRARKPRRVVRTGETRQPDTVDAISDPSPPPEPTPAPPEPAPRAPAPPPTRPAQPALTGRTFTTRKLCEDAGCARPKVCAAADGGLFACTQPTLAD